MRVSCCWRCGLGWKWEGDGTFCSFSVKTDIADSEALTSVIGVPSLLGEVVMIDLILWVVDGVGGMKSEGVEKGSAYLWLGSRSRWEVGDICEGEEEG